MMTPAPAPRDAKMPASDVTGGPVLPALCRCALLYALAVRTIGGGRSCDIQAPFLEQACDVVRETRLELEAREQLVGGVRAS